MSFRATRTVGTSTTDGKGKTTRSCTGLSLGIKDGKLVMPKGLIKDQKVNVLFETLMLHTSDIDDFDKLPIPYRAVATDLETGEMVVLKEGRLADAARASMSVPRRIPPC